MGNAPVSVPVAVDGFAVSVGGFSGGAWTDASSSPDSDTPGSDKLGGWAFGSVSLDPDSAGGAVDEGGAPGVIVPKLSNG